MKQAKQILMDLRAAVPDLAGCIDMILCDQQQQYAFCAPLFAARALAWIDVNTHRMALHVNAKSGTFYLFVYAENGSLLFATTQYRCNYGDFASESLARIEMVTEAALKLKGT